MKKSILRFQQGVLSLIVKVVNLGIMMKMVYIVQCTEKPLCQVK